MTINSFKSFLRVRDKMGRGEHAQTTTATATSVVIVTDKSVLVGFK